MILCGSALTVMGRLLGGGAPLRGRARLELVVRPFGFREAAEFWDVARDPELAFRLHALTGGTPAYKDMCGGAGPRSLADLQTLGGLPGDVRPAEVACREHHGGHEPVPRLLKGSIAGVPDLGVPDLVP